MKAHLIALVSSVFLVACALEPDGQIPPDDLDTTTTASTFSTCDEVSCLDVSYCAETCEALYGASSGKPYSIFAAFGDNPCVESTNSDCYSMCFRNCCITNGANTNGGNNQGEDPVVTEDMPICTCHMNGVHNYWCCDTWGADPNETHQGWSDVEYCRARAEETVAL